MEEQELLSFSETQLPAECADAVLKRLHQALLPRPEDREKRELVIKELQDLVNDVLNAKTVKVVAYGSYLSKVDCRTSDLDLMVTGVLSSSQLSKLVHDSSRFPADSDEPHNLAGLRREDKADLLHILRRPLLEGNVAMPDDSFVMATGARVPVMSFTHRETGISCDICIGNDGAYHKSDMLHKLTLMDARVAPFIYLVKRWARVQHLNDSTDGTFNTWSLNMMAVFILQQAPAILPPLKDLFPQPVPRPMQRPDFMRDPDCLEPDLRHLQKKVLHLKNRLFPDKNRKGLFELLCLFFEEFMALCAVWIGGRPRDDRKTVSVWEGRKVSHRWHKPYLVLIEDPFDDQDNTARTIGTKSIAPQRMRVLHAFRTAHSAVKYARTICTSDTKAARVGVLGALTVLFGRDVLSLLRDYDAQAATDVANKLLGLDRNAAGVRAPPRGPEPRGREGDGAVAQQQQQQQQHQQRLNGQQWLEGMRLGGLGPGGAGPGLGVNLTPPEVLSALRPLGNMAPYNPLMAPGLYAEDQHLRGVHDGGAGGDGGADLFGGGRGQRSASAPTPLAEGDPPLAPALLAAAAAAASAGMMRHNSAAPPLMQSQSQPQGHGQDMLLGDEGLRQLQWQLYQRDLLAQPPPLQQQQDWQQQQQMQKVQQKLQQQLMLGQQMMSGPAPQQQQQQVNHQQHMFAGQQRPQQQAQQQQQMGYSLFGNMLGQQGLSQAGASRTPPLPSHHHGTPPFGQHAQHHEQQGMNWLDNTLLSQHQPPQPQQLSQQQQLMQQVRDLFEFPSQQQLQPSSQQQQQQQQHLLQQLQQQQQQQQQQQHSPLYQLFSSPMRPLPHQHQQLQHTPMATPHNGTPVGMASSPADGVARALYGLSFPGSPDFGMVLRNPGGPPLPRTALTLEELESRHLAPGPAPPQKVQLGFDVPNPDS